ncbi:MAG: hypothetical protein RL385_5853 [Pseudomonadota bacterium]
MRIRHSGRREQQRVFVTEVVTERHGVREEPLRDGAHADAAGAAPLQKRQRLAQDGLGKTAVEEGSAMHGEEFDAGDVQTVLGRLSDEGATRLYVDGGRVIQQFLAADPLDDLTLSVLPVVLGSGIPLFGQGAPERWLSLESARSFQTWLVQLRYRRTLPTG